MGAAPPLRKRIYTVLEGELLKAQYPDAQVQVHSAYRGMGKTPHTRYHLKCFDPRTVANAGRDKFFMVDARLYAPHRCQYCGMRDLRVTRVGI